MPIHWGQTMPIGAPFPAFCRFHRPIALAVSLALTSAHSTPSIVATNFSERTVASEEALSLTLSQTPGDARLIVWIGHVDVSNLVRHEGVTVSYPAGVMPLPVGQHEITVWLALAQGAWIEVGKTTLRVAAGAPESGTPPNNNRLQPRLQLQGTASHLRPAPANGPVSSLQGGMQWNVQGTDWQLESQATIAGDSTRASALQFGTRGANASKVDLASYLVDARVGGTRVSFGHITTGQNPLLQMGLGHRGVALQQRFNERLDATFAIQNGSSIVGLQRALGVYDRNHSMTSAVIGAEVYPDRQGGLRFEVMALSAEQSSNQPGVATAQVRASEGSRGFGARALMASTDQRGKAEVAFAQSRYFNQPDPLTPPVNSTRRHAYLADLSWQFLREHTLESLPGWPLSVTTMLRHEYAEPLYKSLAAGWGADYQQTTATLQSNLGAANFQVVAINRSDNVDRVAAILSNRMASRQATLMLPLAQMLPLSSTVKPYVPTANLSWQTVDQYGTRPPPDLSPSSIPHVFTTTQTATFTWNFERVSVTAGLTRNRQDNRQIDNANADVSTLSQTYNISWRALDNLNLTLGYGPSRNYSGDVAVTRNTRNPQFGFNWTGENGWQASGNYNFDRSFDSAATSVTRGYGFNTTVAKALQLPTPWGSPLPLNVQLRHFITQNLSRTATGETSTRNSGVVLLVTVNFF
jgi:hypothetical protein